VDGTGATLGQTDEVSSRLLQKLQCHPQEGRLPRIYPLPVHRDRQASYDADRDYGPVGNLPRHRFASDGVLMVMSIHGY